VPPRSPYAFETRAGKLRLNFSWFGVEIMHFLFARNEEANNWLSDHPIVLGAGAILLGLTLVGLGVASLLTGRAPAKRGPDLEGGNAKIMAFVWLGFGGLCLLFGAFKIVTGIM
jgi:hypothetical protein